MAAGDDKVDEIRRSLLLQTWRGLHREPSRLPPRGRSGGRLPNVTYL